MLIKKISVYLDTTYISTPYGKYIDDAFTIVSYEEDAIELFNSIASQDPDGLLNWEIDFPKSTGDYIPFLGTSVSIDMGGGLKFRYYRKSQKKNITLHAKVTAVGLFIGRYSPWYLRVGSTYL